LSFIIAEIGVNWNGDLNLVEDMMSHAKNTGCDAVKFQAFNKSIIGNHPEYEKLMKTSISESNIETINDLSQSVGIEWFCTPMYAESINFLNPYVKRFKIREFDSRKLLENKTTNLIEKVLETGKEIIISSQHSLENSKFHNDPKIKSLYCIPKYPCNLIDLDFSELEKFDGYSNHCPQIIAPLSAAILGAKIIEIHITSDKNKNFIDNNVSFDYNELEKTIKLIRLFEKIKT
jgi:N,N'-diacetyllegionaminate synthase